MDRNEKQQQKSDELVAGPREQRYGHPKDNYRRIAHIWSAVLGIEVTPTQAVLCELGVKFSRLIQSPDDEDTQVDVHGYIKVLQRLLDPDDKPFVAAKDYVPEPIATITSGPHAFAIRPEDHPIITFTDGSKEMSFEQAVGWTPHTLHDCEEKGCGIKEEDPVGRC